MKCSVFERTVGDPNLLKEYVSGKRVWEIGAGDGGVAQSLKEVGSDVTCVEIDPSLAFRCMSKGLPTIEEDFVNLVPDCDVIYSFLPFVGTCLLTIWLKSHDFKGTVISQYYPLHEEPTTMWKPDIIVKSELPFLIYDFSRHV